MMPPPLLLMPCCSTVNAGTLGPKYAAVKEERIQSDVNTAAAENQAA